MMQVFCNPFKYYSFLFILFLILLPLSSVTANSNHQLESSTDYFDLGLEELMELDVSVASIKPESIVKTPAIVSSYSTKDLEKMGLRSLREILSFIPGIFIQSSNIPMDSLMVRGVSETFNQKILLLIDDVPYWGPSHSQIPLLGLPLEAIDHIEVIRGPGAVIYGTNASAGVIKVVTKKFSADNSLAIRTGSHDHVNSGGFYSTSFSDSVDLSLGFEAQSEKGYKGFFKNEVKLSYLPDDQQTSGIIREKMEMKSLFTKLRVDNLNMMFQVFESQESGSLGAAPTHPKKPAIGESNGYILHADYSWDIEQTNVKAYTDYNVAYTEAYESEFLPGIERLVQFSDSGNDNYRWRTGLTLNHYLSDDLSIFAGTEFEYRSVGDYKMFIDNIPVITQLEKQNLQEVSAFGQIDYKLKDFRFLLGARYTDNENAGSAITPRASFIYSIDQSQSIKLLYSEGFNSPNFLQTSVTLPFIVGNPQLKAERVKTLDLAYTYSKSNSLFVINAYRMEAKDFISRVPGVTTLTYDNSGGFERHGLEMDFQYQQGKLQSFFNASYIIEGNSVDNGDSEAYHTPKLTGNMAFHYNIFEHHGVGTSLRYVGSRSGIDAYLIWNLDYQFTYNKIELFATLKNLLDEDAYTRDMAGFSPEPVPVSDPQINFLVGIKYSF